MKDELAPQPVTHNEFLRLFTRTVTTDNFFLGFLGVDALILIFFGYHIFFIALGLIYGYRILALTFDPPYRLLRSIFRFQALPPHLVKPSLRRTLFYCASLIIPAFLIFLGMAGLHNGGFCAQNLICRFGQVLFR
jgi:hypothetical protein